MLVMEHYSALKRKATLTTATVGLSLEDIMLRDISQSQQDSTATPLIGVPRGVDPQTESRRWGPGLRGERWELVFNGDQVSVWEDEKILEMEGGDDCTTALNVLNATELYLQMVMRVTLCYMWFTTIKNILKERRHS